MKKIAKRLILFLGFAAATGFFTYSYFSDTETSTGNTFAAGKLDLIVNVDDNQPFTNNLFNLLDMKPGDPGEKTVKIKVEDNPACGTVAVNLTSDLDNSCTEPEGKAENATGNNNCNATGELNDALNFGIFADANCNNIYETGDIFLTQGTLTGNVSYNIGELGTTEKCYGVEWCFGTMTVNETAHTIACDGSLLGNISQTDSFTADLVVTALQKRNQFDGGCPVDGIVSPTCTPTNNGIEVCDTFDNDCDGTADDGGVCTPEANCHDGLDNDSDSAIDCADFGCYLNSNDCKLNFCGNLICETGETFANCPADCQAPPAPQCTTNANCTDDGKACTSETCVNGSCVRTPNNNMCFNTNSCLMPTCVGAIPGADMWGCAYQASGNIGTSCWSTGCLGNCNGWACNAQGACVAPAPGQNPPPTGCTADNQCSDNDTCTIDYCDNGNPRTCKHTNKVVTDCPLFGGSCTNGVSTCNPNPNCPNNCDDGNACTIDTCEISGCAHTATPNNQNCPSGAGEYCDTATGNHYCQCYLPGLNLPCSISIPTFPDLGWN